MVKLTDQIVYIRTKTTPENVKKLNLWGCEIDDIELCEKMKNIEILSLSLNSVSSLQPLGGCRHLRELYLRKNKIESLSELEHLRGLKELRVLWIDENPCTIANEHRHKVLNILPQLTRLDDKPVCVEDYSKQNLKEDFRRNSRDSLRASTLTLVNNPISCGHAGPSIVDTIMPSQFVRYSSASPSEASEEESAPVRCGMSPSMSQSMHSCLSESMSPSMFHSVHPLMSQSFSSSSMTHSMYQPSSSHHEEKEDDWGDFSLEETRESSRPLSIDGIARHLPPCYERGYHTMRSHSNTALIMSARSVSAPRRRLRQRTESSSPARDQRVEKIMSAVSLLMDELDSHGLKAVMEEAQKRIKKQR